MLAPSPLKSPDRFAIVLMIGLCASWGLNQVATKYALSEITPLVQAASRSLIATVVLGAFALWRSPGLFTRDGTLGAGVLCGLGFALEFFLLFVGLQWTSASHAILFLYTAPFFVALGLVWVMPNERLTRLQWCGLALSFVGVALAMRVSAVTTDMLIGDVMCLVAGMAWAATTLVVKGSKLRTASAEKTLLYQLAVSAVALGIAALVSGESLPRSVSPLVAISFAYQTLWIVCVTFLAWFWMVSQYKAAELSAYTFMTPLFGIAAGHFLLGDPLSVSFLIAAALVTAGIFLVSWPTNKML